VAQSRSADIVNRLAANRRFKSWRDLPTAFLAETAELSPEAAIDVAGRLWALREHRFLYAATTLLDRHPTAYRKIRWQVLEPLGNQMDHWGAVDQFAVLAGPAWRDGRLSDAQVLRWTRSKNRWWRRAALVCTVCLNRKSWGGRGDPARTLAVCEQLADDHDDMVAKAMSWALRDLIPHDRRGVERFLRRHEEHLPALVKREVRNKLITGVKNPSRRRGRARGARQP
jgi:3-methyladenine DNA glycosylase AlkD